MSHLIEKIRVDTRLLIEVTLEKETYFLPFWTADALCKDIMKALDKHIKQTKENK